MALFIRKKNSTKQAEKKSTTDKAVKSARVPPSSSGKVSAKHTPVSGGEGKKVSPAPPFVLATPRITEKASLHAEKRVYSFNVARGARKTEIAQAVRALYGVVPERVHVSAIPRKKKFVRGKRGKTALGKKAYVYLKKGDVIESL